jgi:hypothetical protein
MAMKREPGSKNLTVGGLWFTSEPRGVGHAAMSASASSTTLPASPRSASAKGSSDRKKKKKSSGKRRSKSSGNSRRKKTPAHGRSVTSSSASGSDAKDELKRTETEAGVLGRVDDNDLCVICQQDIDVRLDCAMLDCCPHIFHYSCIRRWSGVKSSCPSCRKPFLNIEKVEVEDQVDAIVPLTPAEALSRPRLGVRRAEPFVRQHMLAQALDLPWATSSCGLSFRPSSSMMRCCETSPSRALWSVPRERSPPETADMSCRPTSR